MNAPMLLPNLTARPKPKPPESLASAIQGSAAYVWSERLAAWIGFAICEVGPDTAAKVIGTNFRTRRNHRVVHYSRMQSAGLWQLTPQSLVFYNNGERADGDHRLAAVIHSGKTVPFMITWGWPTSINSILDTGLPRASVDFVRATLGGVWDNVKIGAVKVLASQSTDNASMSSCPNEVLADLCLELQEPMDKVYQWFHKGGRKDGIRRADVLAVLVAATFRHPHEKIAKFCEGLSSGLGMNIGSEQVALLARNKLLNEYRGHGTASNKQEIISITFQAIESFVSGHDRKHFTKMDYRLGILLPDQLQRSLSSQIASVQSTPICNEAA